MKQCRVRARHPAASELRRRARGARDPQSTDAGRARGTAAAERVGPIAARPAPSLTSDPGSCSGTDHTSVQRAHYGSHARIVSRCDFRSSVVPTPSSRKPIPPQPVTALPSARLRPATWIPFPRERTQRTSSWQRVIASPARRMPRRPRRRPCWRRRDLMAPSTRWRRRPRAAAVVQGHDVPVALDVEAGRPPGRRAVAGDHAPAAGDRRRRLRGAIDAVRRDGERVAVCGDSGGAEGRRGRCPRPCARCRGGRWRRRSRRRSGCRRSMP